MSAGLSFLLLALACYRVTRLLVADHWPPVVWARARIVAGVKRIGRDWSVGVTCPWCVGVYVAIAGTWIANVWIRVRYPWLWALAIAATTGLIAENLDHYE